MLTYRYQPCGLLEKCYEFQKILGNELEWVVCANQTHRGPGHNLVFIENCPDYGLAASSLEGLESSNFSSKYLDDHYTFRGNRKAANRGVFKLLRLRGSRTLRKYIKNTKVGSQKCSVCSEKGHNKKSKLCRGYQIEVNSREDGFFEIGTSLGWGVFVDLNDD